ncbi:MAG: zinc-ribbon domain-containing protein [Eubacteriales bacterium]|nr:zinc-ribbon domain-containing protein [Eubacteriales bacterium]
MALINCPECGREISDKAVSCPHCGYPIEKLLSKNEFTSSEEVDTRAFQDNDVSQSEPNRCKICGKALIDNTHVYCDACRVNIKKTAYATRASSKMKKADNQIDMGNMLMTTTRWLVAAFIVLLAICLFAACGIKGVFTFILLMICSFFISPLSKKVSKSLPKWLKVTIPIVFFFAAIIVTPSSNSKDTASISEVEGIEQTEIEKETPIAIATASSEENIVSEMESELSSETEPSDIIYEDIFDLELKENWSDYHEKYIRTTFEVGRCEDEYIESSYKDGYLRIYPDNYREFEYGDYITVSGKITGKTGSYVEIEEGHIEESGSDALSTYDEELSAYNERKAIEAAEYEASFKEEAEKVSYENLARYSDTYKDIKIKITVTIKEVQKKDSLLFADSYIASMSGNEIAVYDERETKEPKLLEGDKVIIYGYGNGLTEIKTYDRSGIIPKVIDKRKIPAITIEFIEIQ